MIPSATNPMLLRKTAAPLVNYALATNGGVASASSQYSEGFAAQHAINGNRSGATWGVNGGWNDNTIDVFPDWLQVDFSQPRQISLVNVFMLQDNYAAPAEPTLLMTFSLYGLTAFEVQYWTGSSWSTIPGTAVTGNQNVWRQFIFSPITTSRIRLFVSSSVDDFSRVAELEAWGV